MLSFLAATLGVREIVLIVVCVAVVLSVTIVAILRKRKGKCSCCDECDGKCPHCKDNNHVDKT